MVNYGESTECDQMKQGIIPRGWFAAYARAHPQLATKCGLSATKKLGTTSKNYKRILQLYSRAFNAFAAEYSTVVERRIVPSAATESAVAESDPPAVNHFAKFKYVTQRMGSQYYSTRARFTREWLRRRDFGGGRKRACTTIRRMLIMWYNNIRHSVNVNVMCSFPNKVLLVKALMLQQDYYVSCIQHKVTPEHVAITRGWQNDFLDEYRISSRRPNRKFKVPREVLKESLKICLRLHGYGRQPFPG